MERSEGHRVAMASDTGATSSLAPPLGLGVPEADFDAERLEGHRVAMATPKAPPVAMATPKAPPVLRRRDRQYFSPPGPDLH